MKQINSPRGNLPRIKFQDIMRMRMFLMVIILVRVNNQLNRSMTKLIRVFIGQCLHVNNMVLKIHNGGYYFPDITCQQMR